VHHAHQKGIIHRDLKPTNVLVTLHDGRPVPKVIDFGIAKPTQARLTEKTLFTEFRQMIGTPQYMSPEQALGQSAQPKRADLDPGPDASDRHGAAAHRCAAAWPTDPRRSGLDLHEVPGERSVAPVRIGVGIGGRRAGLPGR
jgi:serine/threonine protein kinase